MIDRRRFVGAASLLGLMTSRFGPGTLLAQEPGRPVGAKSARVTPEPDDRVNRILESARTGGRRLPGMIGAVVRGEEIEAIGAVGIRKIGSTEPMQPDDQVHLGSDTKAMTATMIGTLVDEGKLGWETTLGDVFSDRAASFHPDFRKVTLAQLLAHRAGLPHDGPWWNLGRGLSTTDQRRALVTRMLRDAPLDPPGAKFDYSNVGYAIAGLMAEQVAKSPWEQLMRQRLFGPLRMDSAGFGAPGKPGKVDQPWGHQSEGDTLKPAQLDNAPSMGPAGTVHCSVPDWAKFISLHLHGSFEGVRPVKPETMRALHTPRPGEDYVGGWGVSEQSRADGTVLMHSGSNTVWYCTAWLAPARDVAFLVVANAGGEPANRACDEATRGLMAYSGFDRVRRR